MCLPVEANKVPNIWIDSVWFGNAPLALAPTSQLPFMSALAMHDAREGIGRLAPVPSPRWRDLPHWGLTISCQVCPQIRCLRFTHGAPGPHHFEGGAWKMPRFNLTMPTSPGVQCAKSGIEIFHWTERQCPFSRGFSTPCSKPWNRAQSPFGGGARHVPSPPHSGWQPLTSWSWMPLEAPSSGEACALLERSSWTAREEPCDPHP